MDFVLCKPNGTSQILIFEHLLRPAGTAVKTVDIDYQSHGGHRDRPTRALSAPGAGSGGSPCQASAYCRSFHYPIHRTLVTPVSARPPTKVRKTAVVNALPRKELADYPDTPSQTSPGKAGEQDNSYSYCIYSSIFISLISGNVFTAIQLPYSCIMNDMRHRLGAAT